MTIGRSGSGRSGSGSLTWFDSRANEVKLTQLRSICLVDKDEIHAVAAQLRGGEDGHVLRRGARLQGNQVGVEAGAAQPGSQQLNLPPLIVRAWRVRPTNVAQRAR